MKAASFETSDGVRLCYSAHLLEEDARPLLVFIPGWTMPAAIWERQCAWFAGKASMVTFDPRGQGESATPTDGYGLGRRARDIAELLGCFPGRRIVLVAWSLAVLEALAYADAFGPASLAGLVLVDNSIGEGPDEPPASGENPFFAELRTQREATLRRFVDAIFRGSPPPALKRRILASALKTDVEDSIRLLSHGKPRAYWRETLYRLPLPILYLVTPRWADQAEQLAARHPQAAVRVFADAGHALFWDAADAFNRAVEDFLGRL